MKKIEEVNLEKILPSNGPSVDEVAKYLSKYKNEDIVIKVGGSVLNEPNLFKILIEDISILKKLNFNPCLVHGGGKRLTNKLNELNIQSSFINGLRVTDEKVISIVEDVFIKFNKEIVYALKNHSSDAKGIHSKENNIINVKKVSEELGFVGVPNEININILKKIIESNEIPVIAPLGLSLDNHVYNINADTAAGAIAKKLKARRLLIVSDVQGVLDKEKNLITEINSSKANQMITNNIIYGGMIPKINNCIDVANNGVKGVVIIDGRRPHSILFELLSDKGAGTLIRK
jgi:acetylglutamate kinase